MLEFFFFFLFRTVKPLVTEEEYMVTEEIVKKFGSIDGIGQKLQQKLQERKNNTENWVSLSYEVRYIL